MYAVTPRPSYYFVTFSLNNIIGDPTKMSIHGFIDACIGCLKFMENISKLLFILLINFLLFHIIIFTFS